MVEIGPYNCRSRIAHFAHFRLDARNFPVKNFVVPLVEGYFIRKTVKRIYSRKEIALVNVYTRVLQNVLYGACFPFGVRKIFCFFADDFKTFAYLFIRQPGFVVEIIAVIRHTGIWIERLVL